MTPAADAQAGTPGPPAITFDVYTALIDSRRGMIDGLGPVADAHGWSLDVGTVVDHFDAASKRRQREITDWIPFRRIVSDAMAETSAALDLSGDADDIATALLATIHEWPHYEDVPDGVAAAAATHDVAVLTNTDDDLLARTRTGYAFPDGVTSEQARAYKPHPGIYRVARERFGPLVHVAGSARDVRGAGEAGLTVVRVARPGQRVDPNGPAPDAEVADLRDLPGVLAGLAAR
ncbi:haloacid dehalogenase [Egibacter rhizosphaerae]|uniref:Haloacid dehalogenase n=1 Tax=Egibacter rhizosphaerae TaxID=1670831 RepID=A0A411YJW7_9ACTN|nr:haloacid dehalogenase [Egibacter rhizosphaerae]QBI21483.1 haloacid dehalogenase [Egibacter rhizosphaerae]